MPDDPGPNSNAANKRMYQKFLDDDKLARDDMLIFMELDIEILFEEHKTSKEMFDAISITFSSSSKPTCKCEKYNSSNTLDSENLWLSI